MSLHRLIHRRALGIVATLAILIALFVYGLLTAGPWAPVAVTLATVRSKVIAPARFGIGTVEAKQLHRIGPLITSRVRSVHVQVGDHVTAGQILGEMDPVDLQEKMEAQEALLRRAQANVATAQAQLQEATTRRTFSEGQTRRYEQLFAARAVTAEMMALKRQELDAGTASMGAAAAGLEAARQELNRQNSEKKALARQRQTLVLRSPVSGIVTQRNADPGTTVVAGLPVLEVVEAGALWIHARFDQRHGAGLQAGLPGQVVLRSLGQAPRPGRLVRIEPRADPVTEEILAKVEFDSDRPPPIGELAEVTISLPNAKALPVVPGASLQRIAGQLGVWMVESGHLRFTPVVPGASNLEGEYQIEQGLQGGEIVVVYSQKPLEPGSRIKIVEQLPASRRRTEQ